MRNPLRTMNRRKSLRIMNSKRFMEARARALLESGKTEGIGRLSEKTLHKTIKYYLEPNEACHEVKLLGSIADIANSYGIFEIQTRAAYKLIPKIRKFLGGEYPVTLVLPLAAKKAISWVDRESGEISPPRKSPKSASIFDALYEISAMSEFIKNPKFRVKLIFIDATEFRYFGKYGKKRRTERIELIANFIISEYEISGKWDIESRILIPEEEFTAKEFQRLTKRDRRRTYYILKLLESLEIIESAGKIKNAVIYRKNERHI